ncbi:MAG: hypothetical protein O2897_02270 [bacterium]|nr:hypothetical protein [bacterium]
MKNLLLIIILDVFYVSGLLASTCPDVFGESKDNYALSYERRCTNSNYKNSWRDESFKGEMKILNKEGGRLGSYLLQCSTFENSEIVLQLVDKDSNFAGYTLILGGDNGAKSIYFYDCNEQVVFYINIGSNKIMINGELVETSVSVYSSLGSYPVMFIGKEDYDNGLLNFRTIKLSDILFVEPVLNQDTSCHFPQWKVESSGYSSSAGNLENDPRIMSLLIAYLAISKDSFNSCTQLSWKPFGLTFVIPAAVLSMIGTVKLVKYLRERHRPGGNIQYIRINDDDIP